MLNATVRYSNRCADAAASCPTNAGTSFTVVRLLPTKRTRVVAGNVCAAAAQADRIRMEASVRNIGTFAAAERDSVNERARHRMPLLAVRPEGDDATSVEVDHDRERVS